MNGQSYYQYQLATHGTPGLVMPQNYVQAGHGGVVPGQTIVMNPHAPGFSFVPPPPPPAAGGVAQVAATDYSGSTISAPASLYSQNDTSSSTSTEPGSPKAAMHSTSAATTAVTEVVSSSYDMPKSTEVVQESTINKLDTPNGSTPTNEAPMVSATMTQQMSIAAQQQQQMISAQQKQAELQQVLARSPMPAAYGMQKTAQGVYAHQMQLANQAAQAQPTIVMDAYGRQYLVQNPAAVPKVQHTSPMIAGGNYMQQYALANPAAKLHTTTTVELPQGQQAAYPNVYLPNGYMPAPAVQPQAAYAMPGGYYNPAAGAAMQDPAQAGGYLQRQQLVQYNGQTYVAYVPQQVVSRKY